jgi:RNA polymerase sigma-70 factor (ECF subfamily)
MPLSDEELMARAARGDVAAFGLLFDRTHGALYAFLCRYLDDATTAEDVAQEAFWRMWEHRHTFDPTRPFRAWAYAVARNAARDELRRPHRRAARLEDAPAGDGSGLRGEVDGGLGSDGCVRQLALREQVRAALAALPEEQRLCLVLREYEGRSHAEIAAVIGCTEGAARVLAHRARRALRDRLAPVLEGEESVV